MEKTMSKKEVIDFCKLNDKDNGSVEVQIGILSWQIGYIQEHMRKNRHDNHTRRGLLQKVGKKRRLLQYLELNEPKRYKEFAKKTEDFTYMFEKKLTCKYCGGHNVVVAEYSKPYYYYCNDCDKPII